MGSPEDLARASGCLIGAGAAAGWAGPDVYDALWWRWPRALVAGRRRRQLLIQAHARSPLDLRRLYRRRHPIVPKALGVLGSAGLRLQAVTPDRAVEGLARSALELLMRDVSSGSRGWGYPWDMQTRWSFYPAGTANVVATAFSAAALLEGGRHFERDDMTQRARQAARWILDELWVPREGFFAYHPQSRVPIHNASLLGACLVRAAEPDDAGAREAAARAIERVLAAQRADGTWPYGDAPGLSWVDSFHTGYVLCCLDRQRDLDPRVEEAVARGVPPYERFFDTQGRAKLWADRRYPEDGHSAGTGLTTLAMTFRRGLTPSDFLWSVANRVLEHMIRDGRVVFRRYRWGSTRVHYLRWCDSHVALGLADAARALATSTDQGQTKVGGAAPR